MESGGCARPAGAPSCASWLCHLSKRHNEDATGFLKPWSITQGIQHHMHLAVCCSALVEIRSMTWRVATIPVQRLLKVTTFVAVLHNSKRSALTLRCWMSPSGLHLMAAVQPALRTSLTHGASKLAALTKTKSSQTRW